MSVTKTYTVWCDEPKCFAWTSGSGTANTAHSIRCDAKQEGWTVAGRDLCPYHSKHSVKDGG